MRQARDSSLWTARVKWRCKLPCSCPSARSQASQQLCCLTPLSLFSLPTHPLLNRCRYRDYTLLWRRGHGTDSTLHLRLTLHLLRGFTFLADPFPLIKVAQCLALSSYKPQHPFPKPDSLAPLPHNTHLPPTVNPSPLTHVCLTPEQEPHSVRGLRTPSLAH